MINLKTEDIALIEQIKQVLRDNQNFFIGTHVFPDGDNVGSLLSMKEILDQLGKKSYLYCETEIPRIYSWLEGSQFIHSKLPEFKCNSYDVVIALDSGDLSRIGEKFQDWYECDKIPIVNIDHHITNTYYGSINWVSAEHAATGEQVLELVSRLNLNLTDTMAVALYTAIFTDTGRFSYSNTSARTMRYAADLVEKGVNPNLVYRKVYGNRSMSALNLELEALNSLTFVNDLQMAYLLLTREMVERAGSKMEESEGIIEHIGLFGESIRNILFFKEISDKEIKVSVRTKGEMDASKLSMLFGGGGHPRAGGYSLFNMTIHEAVTFSINMIRKAASMGELEPPKE